MIQKEEKTASKKLWAHYYIIPGKWTPQLWKLWDQLLQTKLIAMKHQPKPSSSCYINDPLIVDT